MTTGQFWTKFSLEPSASEQSDNDSIRESDEMVFALRKEEFELTSAEEELCNNITATLIKLQINFPDIIWVRPGNGSPAKFVYRITTDEYDVLGKGQTKKEAIFDGLESLNFFLPEISGKIENDEDEEVLNSSLLSWSGSSRSSERRRSYSPVDLEPVLGTDFEDDNDSFVKKRLTDDSILFLKDDSPGEENYELEFTNEEVQHQDSVNDDINVSFEILDGGQTDEYHQYEEEVKEISQVHECENFENLEKTDKPISPEAQQLESDDGNNLGQDVVDGQGPAENEDQPDQDEGKVIVVPDVISDPTLKQQENTSNKLDEETTDRSQMLETETGDLPPPEEEVKDKEHAILEDTKAQGGSGGGDVGKDAQQENITHGQEPEETAVLPEENGENNGCPDQPELPDEDDGVIEDELTQPMNSLSCQPGIPELSKLSPIAEEEDADSTAANSEGSTRNENDSPEPDLKMDDKLTTEEAPVIEITPACPPEDVHKNANLSSIQEEPEEGCNELNVTYTVDKN